MEPTTPPADGREPVSLGESIARLLQVLWQPTATFRRIGDRPSWAIALLALVGIAILTGALVDPKIDPKSLREFFEDRGMPQEQIEQALDRQFNPSPAARYLQVVAKVAGSLVWWLATAALFFGAARLAGSEIGYRRALAVTTHGMQPFVVAGLVAIPVILSRPSIHFRETFSGSFLASHLGVLVSEDAGAVVQALLSSVDVFSIWCIVLLFFGFSVVGRLTKGAATGVVLVPWLLGVAAKVGMAAAFGGVASGG